MPLATIATHDVLCVRVPPTMNVNNVTQDSFSMPTPAIQDVLRASMQTFPPLLVEPVIPIALNAQVGLQMTASNAIKTTT